MKQFYKLLLSVLLFSLSLTNSFSAGLKGTYTIDNSGKGKPDFTTIHAAITSLMINGVSGAVAFKIADGTYNESITLGKITGASSTNFILFASASNDSSKVILDTNYSGPGSDYGYAISLRNTSYVTFREISIINTSSTLANAVQYSGGCSHISFENCFIKTEVSTNNYGYAIFDSNSIDNNITFKNNHIRGGEVGVYAFGGALKVGGTKEKALLLIHNIIDSSWYDGVLLYSIDSVVISGNIISSATFALSLDNSYVTTKDSSLISNNFITSNGWGAWISITDKLKFYYNSVYTTTNVSYYYAAGFNNGYVSTTSNNFIYNNIFVSTGKGPALYMTYTAAKKCDYNDIYSTGGTIALWNNTGTSTKTTCTKLSDWQKASKFDKNSASADPYFNSVLTNDLHLTTASIAVLHKATKLSDVLYDIDGSVRGNAPSMGADDVFQLQTDAAILSVDSPAIGFCAGTKDIYAHLFNAGIDSLKSVDINWSINGIAQTTISWKGGLGLYGTDQMKLGSIVFTSATIKTIKVWSSNPNGVTDSNAKNDTVVRVMTPGLSGTYIIGGAGGTTFTAAATQLNNYGVCGAVVFNALDGSYNEKVLLKNIPGTSAINTVTFQSKGLDSSKVMLYYAYPSPYYFPYESYVIRMQGTQYVTFRKLSIVNTETSAAAENVVVMENGANHITLESNNIFTNTISNTGAVIFTNPNTEESHITINNNHITGGNYSVFMGGVISSKGPIEYSNVITGNTMDSASSVSLYLQFQDSMQIIANKITNMGSYGVGIYMYDFTSKNQTRVINNFVTCTGPNTYGVYSETVSPLTFAYNSIATTNVCIYTAYFNGFGAKATFNNNIIWASSGVAISASSGSISSSDYNDIYANGWSILASWGATCKTIADLQAATGMDKHSVSVDALFADASMGDLHLTDSSALRKAGTPLKGIPNDVDGEVRNTKTPDIGADEFIRDSFDVGALAIVSTSSCGNTATSITVKVNVRNYGIADASGFRVHATINKTDTASIYFGGKLLGYRGAIPHDTVVSIPFTKTWNTTSGASLTIDAYTDLVNDSNSSNNVCTYTYYVFALPVVKFGYNKACLYDTVQFLDSSKSAAGIATYSWSFGNKLKSTLANPKTIYSSVGKYYVQLNIKDANGCIDSLTKVLIIDSLPNARFTFKFNTTTDTILFQANDFKHSSYTWNFGDGSKNITTKTGNTSHFYNDYFMKYFINLSVINSSGCTNDFTDSAHFMYSSIQNQTTNNTISIYPNPANDKLYLTLPLTPLRGRGEQLSTTITDMSGKLLLTQSITQKQTVIDISKLSQGMYLLHYDWSAMKFVKH